MSAKIKQIHDLLNLMALHFEKFQTEERLAVYCKYLEEFSIEKIKQTIEWNIVNSKFFPQLAEIRERLTSKQSIEDAAIEMASAIIECLSNYGPRDVKLVKEKLGPIAGFVIEQNGWENLCMMSYDQLTIIKAQLRKDCKIAMQISERAPESCHMEFQKCNNARINNINQLKKLEHDL